MERVNVPIFKIANMTTRQVVYSKCRSGLIKKSYELSVLCDIDCALILFSPSGKLTQYSNRRIEDVLIKFLSTPAQGNGGISQIPNKEDLVVLLKNLITHQDMPEQASSQQGIPSYNTPGCWDTEDIREELVKLQNHLDSLKTLTRFASAITNPNCSQLECEAREEILLKILTRITKRKNYLLRKSETSAASSLPITSQHKEGTSFLLEKKLASLGLTDKRKMPMQTPYDGTSGSMNKEKLLHVKEEVLEQNLASLELKDKGKMPMQSPYEGIIGGIKKEKVSYMNQQGSTTINSKSAQLY
ncbi:Agamous-like MADS-box protein AGL66 [Rhynchospora pubera]|uniref:Agamous-like MADS-box protein AGL66 n=1 Tax=Rhynchospora pubera TaxID=906938 RepID=A0AAV8DXI4_9POAL|nr:Agamous-like MADS-box protein AGL66 [Rhynchospora pubera]